MHLRWGVVMARVSGEGLHSEIRFADISDPYFAPLELKHGEPPPRWCI